MEYSAGMVSTLLWWNETQQVAQLIEAGKTRQEIVALAVENNLFHVRNVDRQQRIARLAYKRVQALPAEMVPYLAHADFSTAQVIVLISVMLTERLFKEFCEDVFYQAIVQRSFVITDEDIALFFHDHRQRSPKVASFSESVIKKLKQTIIKFLYDGGLLDRTTGTRTILSPLLAADFAERCKQTGLADYYRILTGCVVL